MPLAALRKIWSYLLFGPCRSIHYFSVVAEMILLSLSFALRSHGLDATFFQPLYQLGLPYAGSSVSSTPESLCWKGYQNVKKGVKKRVKGTEPDRH